MAFIVKQNKTTQKTERIEINRQFLLRMRHILNFLQHGLDNIHISCFDLFALFTYLS